MRFLVLSIGALCALSGGVAPGSARSRTAWPAGVAVVSYRSPKDLRSALSKFPARVVTRVPALGAAELRPAGDVRRFAAAISRLPGIASVAPAVSRSPAAEPALSPSPYSGGSYEWQFDAARENLVPASVLRAAAGVTIAVVDTGADLSAPDLAAKSPLTYSTLTGSSDVSDPEGHGTFVASLAAGSVTNGEGIAGFGGDAKLLVVQAGSPDGSFTDVDEAAAIAYAVDHGAKIVNLSLGGTETSSLERQAVSYAAAHGVLLVAAAGNSYRAGNPVIYPAALVQPVGSNGEGGTGLAVGASGPDDSHASFSSSGSYLSLAAPGVDVFGAVSSQSSPAAWPRTPLLGSAAGSYGFSSGTSFSAPEVTGAAALVWGANPSLQAQQVAAILKETASGAGSWNPELGFGVLNVASAVARAQGVGPPVARATARIVVHASRIRGAGRLRIRVAARLSVRTPGIPASRRLLRLESFERGRWGRIGKAGTNAGGTATWTLSLRQGTHLLRAVFAGAADLAAAASADVSVRVR